ncbi:TIM-barrel domain-containing protein [Fervidibacillus albus]|uniref:Glycoside hydrolase family 31 protein n=1 Tax=Fervidibacillus albus TaxID=2980026 RepID=A0A9E8LU91_9BACI|nr:TIM-barrel domain-containing protein [Fervidibacillus albus]WAA08919.1 glycoside hydrolase family 31 protein [Fervidibacillus albus]
MGNHREKFANLLQILLFQLKGDLKTAEMNLKTSLPDLETDSIFNIGTWVWLLQKQVSLQPSNQDLINIKYQSYIQFLCTKWKEKYPRIWEDGTQDIFLSNLAIVYAALWETKNARNIHSVQKTMTDIRDYVFDHLLVGGTVISGKQDRSVSADQLLAVMPFGMFSPEDLIIVEAVTKMEHLLKNETGILPFHRAKTDDTSATAMMALYFLEKSDYQKAKFFADKVRMYLKKDKLAEVILAIYDFFVGDGLDMKEEIIHEPLGNGNVYVKQLTERIPHFPTLFDNLKLACQIITSSVVKKVFVEISNLDKTWTRQDCLSPVKKEDLIVYEKKISPFPKHGKYLYYFVAELENGEKIVSKTYELSTFAIRKVERFELVSHSEKEIILAIRDLQGSRGLSVKIQDQGVEFEFINHLKGKNQIKKKDGEISIRSDDYQVYVCLDRPKIKIDKNNHRILETHPLFPPIEWKVDADNHLHSFTFHWFSPEDEQFYGFGERYNSVEQRGNIIDCFVYNQYRDQGTRTYFPVPFYLTNKDYACFIDTNTYTSFDLANELKDKCSITIEQPPNTENTKIHYFFGTYKDQVQAFTKKTGKPKMVPVWALGPWMSSNNWDRESVVRTVIEKTKSLNIPATVIVLEQWSDETTYYMFNDAEYDLKHPAEGFKYEEIKFPEWGRWPNPKELIKFIHENHLKLILWQIPIQKYLNKQKHPLKDQDEAYMIEKGYVVKNPDGTPYRIPENWFTGSLLMDFRNEDGRKWWFSKRQYLIDIGVDGFKTDGGEFVFGKDLIFADGQTGSEMRNQYPNDYISAYFEFAQQNGGITFSRAGYTGAQKFPAHWAGDERSTFAAFKRSLIAGINAGLSGIVFWGWDLAGFNGDIPSAELFMRSAAMAAFCPIMQYHAESKAEYNQDRTPWNIAERTGNDEVIKVYRFFANVRMNLIPYIYEQSLKACEKGLPLMRALMIEYPKDLRVRGIYDEYLFGEDLLVAPVIKEGELSRKVYLPEGIWFHFWTNEKIYGPKFIHVSAPMDQIPVFIKANRAILLNLDQTKQIGSCVGNDVSKYHTPVCKIFYNDDFEHTLVDHLNHYVNISVKKCKDILTVNVASDLEKIEIEVVGTNRQIEIVRV